LQKRIVCLYVLWQPFANTLSNFCAHSFLCACVDKNCVETAQICVDPTQAHEQSEDFDFQLKDEFRVKPHERVKKASG
jgi:hypothetical protein